jgi:hypothetical protein
MTLGYSVDVWHNVLCTQSPNMRKRHVVIIDKQRILGVENVTDEEEYKKLMR